MQHQPNELAPIETSAFYDALKSINIESRIQDRVRRRGYDVDR